MTAKQDIADRLRAARETQNLTLDELADRLGTGWSKSRLSRLETGDQKTLDVDDVEKWATALGLHVEVLMWSGADKLGLTAYAAALSPEDLEFVREVAASLPAIASEEVRRAVRGGIRAQLRALRREGR